MIFLPADFLLLVDVGCNGQVHRVVGGVDALSLFYMQAHHIRTYVVGYNHEWRVIRSMRAAGSRRFLVQISRELQLAQVILLVIDCVIGPCSLRDNQFSAFPF